MSADMKLRHERAIARADRRKATWMRLCAFWRRQCYGYHSGGYTSPVGPPGAEIGVLAQELGKVAIPDYPDPAKEPQVITWPRYVERGEREKFMEVDKMHAELAVGRYAREIHLRRCDVLSHDLRRVGVWIESWVAVGHHGEDGTVYTSGWATWGYGRTKRDAYCQRLRRLMQRDSHPQGTIDAVERHLRVTWARRDRERTLGRYQAARAKDATDVQPMSPQQQVVWFGWDRAAPGTQDQGVHVLLNDDGTYSRANIPD